MDLDIPVFDTKGVKRSFYYFFAFNAILTATVVIGTVVFDISFQSYLQRINTWVVFLLLFAGTFYFSQKGKKELNAILETTDIPKKFARYESYYKQKLIWNSFSLVTASILLLLSSKKYFLYLLLLQLVLSWIFYPGKKLLTKELQVEGIVFT